MPRRRCVRVEPSLEHVGPARNRTAELDQPALFDETEPQPAPVADVPDLDFERSRRRFTQGA